VEHEPSTWLVLPVVHNPSPSQIEQLLESDPGLTLALDPHLPPAVGDLLSLPDWLALATDESQASLRLTAGGERLLGRWVYALVAPFPTPVSQVSFEDVLRGWQGKKGGPFSGEPLLMSENTLILWSAVWGTPADGAVQVVNPARLLDQAWENKTAWALIPFEELNPRWKVLAVDDLSPIWTDFNPENYALSLPLTVSGEGVLPDLVLDEYGPQAEQPIIAGSNWRRDRLTTVALTGVTALVRATAFTMEQRGLTYPAQDVGEILRQADILHISNEVPFARNCPYPDPVQPDLKFCSAEKYIELLEHIGADVIELTGDHFADWGKEAMEFTLDLYDERGWYVYGGGRDLASGMAPVTLEHNGNRIAFIGCNAKGGGFAQASPSNPGAVRCDFDYMEEQIRQLRKQDYNVIVTFQHFEYYTYAAQPNQIADALRMAEAGAAIVSGSQAHQPQGMDFSGSTFIHHGLGNLFFDQFEISLATRQGFIDRHVFYEGRHISTELIPILFVDFARPRLMNASEANDLLGSVFSASGW
jgi:poly-gamma-glutamate synthesis protein (capsule biosynthesis protein)